MEKVNIIKIGGNIINDSIKLKNFLWDFALIEDKKILVHGGGKMASEWSKKLGIESKMVKGRRITNEESLKVVTMVYAGLINKNIVANLQANQCNAIGLCGADMNLLPAKKRKNSVIDFGFVGDLDDSKLNVENLKWFLGKRVTPVFSAITHDCKGQLLNTNADTVASALAVSLVRDFTVDLIYLFDKKGVLLNPSDEFSVIELIDKSAYLKFKTNGNISTGMLPKLDNAFHAMEQGVNSVVFGSTDILQNQDALKTTLCLN